MIKLKPISFKLDARSRFLLMAMACALILAAYYRAVYMPKQRAIKTVKERWLSLREEQRRLESTMPDVRGEQAKMREMKKDYDGLSSKVIKAEKVLPKNTNVPDILEFLSRYAKDYGLRLVGVKSRRDKAQDIPLYVPPPDSKQKPITYYSALPIEIEMFGSFDGIIGYIANIEKKLPYQRVGALQVDMQRTASGQPQCFMTVLSILGRGTEEDESVKELKAALAKAAETGALEDPFHKKDRPRAEQLLTGVGLNGIVHKGGVPHAIINGSLYKAGDVLSGKKIIKIEKDTVILEEEDKLFKLTIKGEG